MTYGGQGATWLPDGSIIVPHRATVGARKRLHRIPETRGAPEPLTMLDAENGEIAQTWPHALPGGTDVLFTKSVRDGPDWTQNEASVAVLSLETGEQQVVVEGGYHARYLPTGHLVFVRDGALWGVPFDLDRLATTGPERVVLQGVEVNEQNGATALSVSGDGTLVYWPGDAVGSEARVPPGGRPTHSWSLGSSATIPSRGSSADASLESSTATQSGGSAGCRPRAAEMSASALQARQNASAVWRARSLPLCQTTAGLAPCIAAFSANCSTLAEPGSRGSARRRHATAHTHPRVLERGGDGERAGGTADGRRRASGRSSLPSAVEPRARRARTAVRSHGPWRLSQSKAMHVAFHNAYFNSLGLPRLDTR